uniref:Subtilisin-like protease fibronectin type-III domain-containing protein n=2 Tax=Araucaria cunninghamii TaxID=56994 RepID=A0A0D6QSY6_ARACU
MNIKVDSGSVVLGLLAFLFASNMCRVEAGAGDVERASTYIVHMDKSAMPNVFATHEDWYKSLLYSVKGARGQQIKEIEDSHLYTYDKVLHGFSAKLTQSELDMLEEMPGHVLTVPDPVGTMDTTHSLEFLGLSPDSGLWPASRFGDDVIVAILDTGIWPESRSFLDGGMGPVPSRWKGTCENGTAFDPGLCNRKLIGARYFNKGVVAKYGNIDHGSDFDSARDYKGHGSHTSSTVGGNYVDDVDFYGYAPGTARGVAPAGRIAMYKVLWSKGRMGSDVLAGMERAIIDGADVLSLSLGFPSSPYFQDSIALAAFEAIKRGVLVVCSAGNDGPERGYMHNGAPWIFTVGASTIDRDYAALLTLGDGTLINASSFYINTNLTGNSKISQAPLVYQSGDPACKKHLDPGTVGGTVVLCMNESSSLLQVAKSAGALALLSAINTDQLRLLWPEKDFPVVYLKSIERAALVNYASSTANPVVEIQFGMTVLGARPAPAVASFSSRGPYEASPIILKPDVIAPGVNILAAWRSNVTGEPNYKMDSGTSMSCPHVAGLSALVKAVHRDWSPAAIRSALMTTSYTVDNSNKPIVDIGYRGNPATPLDMGAGHVDPEKAIDPGLVYDLTAMDYVNFLCTLNYTTQQIQIIAHTTVSCPKGVDFGSDALNYPSFTAILKKNAAVSSSVTFKRTLTNVEEEASYYEAVVEAPKGIKVQVYPSVLEFKEKFQKLNFTLTVEAEGGTSVGDEDVRYGYLSWIDKKGHVVKSPLVALLREEQEQVSREGALFE